ncbi:MAG: hypothetical protein ACLFUO_04645 [Candidatus Woesearchaeota archaeon]
MQWDYSLHIILAAILLGVFAIFANIYASFYSRNEKEMFSVFRETRIDEKPLYIRLKGYDSILSYTGLMRGRKTISKIRECSYFSLPLLFSEESMKKSIQYYMDDIGLDTPHKNIDFLIHNLKKLFSIIAYYDYSDLKIKQVLLDHGWDFHMVNSSFREIENELDNMIRESFLIYPNSNIYTIIKKIRIISASGFTIKQVLSSLGRFGYSDNFIRKISHNIRLSQKASNFLVHTHFKNINDGLRGNLFKKSLFSRIIAVFTFRFSKTIQNL